MWFTLSIYRHGKKRDGCCCCIKLKDDYSETACGKRDMLKEFMDNYVGRAILSLPGKVKGSVQTMPATTIQVIIIVKTLSPSLLQYWVEQHGCMYSTLEWSVPANCDTYCSSLVCPLYSSSSNLGLLLLPLDGMPVHCRLYNPVMLSQQYSGTHLYTRMVRGTVRGVSVLPLT